MTENMDIKAVSEAPATKKRKTSKWNRYVKRKANHIKLRSGKLDLKKMAKEFAKSQGKKAVKKAVKRSRK
jgi:hypothetical protein